MEIYSFVLLYLVVVLSSAAFQFCSSRFISPPNNFLINQTTSSAVVIPQAPTAGPTIVLPLSGSVYPDESFSTLLSIGQSPKKLDFDVDTGSDFTWVQCDAPCEVCTKPPDQQYKPKKESYVRCDDPICGELLLNKKGKKRCRRGDDKCEYFVEYADGSNSTGFLVADNFPLTLTNGTILNPRLVFGCGTKQYYPRKHPTPTAGLLGLSHGKISILSQLSGMGIIKNVVGHCLASKGGGFVFLGDVPVASSNIAWVPRNSESSLENFYSAGPAELFHDGKSIGAKDLHIIFDSGSTYTDLSPELYKAVFKKIKEDLKGKPLKAFKAPKNSDLDTCWRGAKPFKSFDEVNNFFKPFMLRFANNKQLHIPPESYLILYRDGYACLGFLPGNVLGINANLVGDVSMQDTMMIFNNVKKEIGWVSANCANIPKSCTISLSPQLYTNKTAAEEHAAA